MAILPVPSEAMYVLLGWYKHRGCTEYAAMSSGSSCPVTLTLEMAEKAIQENKREFYEERAK